MRALAVALALALAPLSAPSQEAPVPTIEITGEGRAEAAPDTATLTAGVAATDGSAEAALARVSEAARRVLAALRGAGIAEADIRTSALSLASLRRRDRDGRLTEETEFEASTDFTVHVRALDRLGGIVDALVRSGANRLGGISFSVADPTALVEEARRDAIAEARRAAETYADAAGLSLGPVRRISEPTGGGPARGRVAVSMAEAAPVPVAPGQVEATASVTVEWTLER